MVSTKDRRAVQQLLGVKSLAKDHGRKEYGRHCCEAGRAKMASAVVNDGEGHRDVARRFGVDRHTVGRWARRAVAGKVMKNKPYMKGEGRP